MGLMETFKSDRSRSWQGWVLSWWRSTHPLLMTVAVGAGDGVMTVDDGRIVVLGDDGPPSGGGDGGDDGNGGDDGGGGDTDAPNRRRISVTSGEPFVKSSRLVVGKWGIQHTFQIIQKSYYKTLKS